MLPYSRCRQLSPKRGLSARRLSLAAMQAREPPRMGGGGGADRVGFGKRQHLRCTKPQTKSQRSGPGFWADRKPSRLLESARPGVLLLPGHSRTPISSGLQERNRRALMLIGFG